MVIFQMKKLRPREGKRPTWVTESWWLHGRPYQRWSLHHHAWGSQDTWDACAEPLTSKIPDHVPTRGGV